MEFQDKYRSQGLATIGVAMDDEGWQKVRSYVSEHPFNYPIVAGDAAALAKRFSVVGLPMTLLIDRDGRIAESHAGMIDKNDWEQEVREVLKERPR
jgi:cytochrome c biogenesis protein CcmG/thiol:disulfide interchange protein DsbE